MKVMPDRVKEYLGKHLLKPVDGFTTYNSLKSALIGSYFGMTRYKDNYYFLGISDLELMGCKPLIKRPGYVKPNFNN